MPQHAALDALLSAHLPRLRHRRGHLTLLLQRCDATPCRQRFLLNRQLIFFTASACQCQRILLRILLSQGRFKVRLDLSDTLFLLGGCCLQALLQLAYFLSHHITARASLLQLPVQPVKLINDMAHELAVHPLAVQRIGHALFQTIKKVIILTAHLLHTAGVSRALQINLDRGGGVRAHGSCQFAGSSSLS